MTGLRIDSTKLEKRLRKIQLSASEFRPELEQFAARVLADCIQATPVRNEALIQANQIKQYHHRVNYIPSYHSLENPSLIVNDKDEAWIYMNAKWYRADWRLPPQVFAAFGELNAERNRRIQSSQTDFVNERKQARFLYQRSWWEVAQSLGLAFAVAAAIISSKSRRMPLKAPAKAFGQWRGGDKVLSVVIQNPFLNEKTKYWIGNGKAILAQATAKERPRFLKQCNDKVKRAISAARQSS